MKKVGIVSFANQKGNYMKMMDRLEFSLNKVGFDGMLYFYNHEKEIHPDCPYHMSDDPALYSEVVPYGFKPWAMKNAIDDGCDIVIWADSAIYATQPLADFIQHIEREGYIFFDNIGYSVGDFTSDKCLEYFEWDREKSFRYKMLMMCLFGINVHNERAMEFFNRYFQAAKDKVPYRGSWDNVNGDVSTDSRVCGARHDQSCGSIIVADLNLTITHGQSTYFAYFEHKSKMQIAQSVCLWSQGL